MKPPATHSGSDSQTLDLLASLDAFLTALNDPEGGLELYRLHAADAPVRDSQGVGLAGHIDPIRFAAAHREISLQGREQLPQFVDPVLRQTTLEPDAAQAVAWFEATEARQGRRVLLALGARTDTDAPRIGWCTLAERIEPWTYRDGLLQSLADYPWMRKAEPIAARALLDASYLRRHGRAPVKFSTLPDARFSCQMSTVCCKHDFEITLPPEAQLLIDAMPWPTLKPQLSGTRLPVRPDGKLQLKASEESCRFLGTVGQCLIHQALGRQPFGACCVFPFSFAATPEGISVALSPICGSTRLGLGLTPGQREDDLRERLVHADPRQADGFRLAPGVQIPWERFRDIERGLCDCLAATDVPMRRRLYVGTRLLGALSSNESVDLPGWLSEPLPDITAELREAIHGMLTRILGLNRAVLRAMPRSVPSDLSSLEVRDAPIVTRILQNTLFCKVYSYPFDLATAHNYLIVLYLLTLMMQATTAGPLTDGMWRELGSLGVHGLLKSALHDGMPEGFRTLLGTPQFGVWMLAA